MKIRFVGCFQLFSSFFINKQKYKENENEKDGEICFIMVDVMHFNNIRDRN
jgi:hypothetical protein